MRFHLFGIILIVVGVFLLLAKFNPDLASLLFDWWPLILIALGVSKLLPPSFRDKRNADEDQRRANS
jgi:hypothetical protein